MKTFNIETETTPVTEFEFVGEQLVKATTNNCERAFSFRFLAGNVNALPKYIKSAIAEAGFRPVYLGGTTYKYSIIGLVRL